MPPLSFAFAFPVRHKNRFLSRWGMVSEASCSFQIANWLVPLQDSFVKVVFFFACPRWLEDFFWSRKSFAGESWHTFPANFSYSACIWVPKYFPLDKESLKLTGSKTISSIRWSQHFCPSTWVIESQPRVVSGWIPMWNRGRRVGKP